MVIDLLIAPMMRIAKHGPRHCDRSDAYLPGTAKLRNIVASKLILDWSPEQISGWLKTQYPDDPSMRVSHETIYRSLFIQARGVLKKELMDYLRSKRRMRRSRHASVHGHRAGRSSMPFPFANDPRRRKTEPFLVIGKAICWPVERTATLRHSWSGIPVFSCSSKCRAKTRRWSWRH